MWQCEYFNLELQLIHQLILVSSHLVRFPPAARKQKLRRMLQTLPSVHTDNLYFPSNIPNAEHYRILRLLPLECISLNSRDKAPYLLYAGQHLHHLMPHLSSIHCETLTRCELALCVCVCAEIEYTRKSTYDYDIYVAYKSNEDIMEESITLCEESLGTGEEGDKAMNGGDNNDGIVMADGTEVIAPITSADRKSSDARGDVTREGGKGGAISVAGKDPHLNAQRPPPLVTANLEQSSTPSKSGSLAKSTHTSSRRPSLSRPLIPGQDPVEQIRQQTQEEQEALVQQGFQDLDNLHRKKDSIGAKLTSVFSEGDAHPASQLGEIASQKKADDEAEQKNQQRVVRIKPLPQPEPILSPTKRNDPPLFRVSSASQPDSPVDSTGTSFGTSAPRAGHAMTLTSLLDRTEGDEKEMFEEEHRSREGDMEALAAATANVNVSGGMKVTVTPDVSSSPTPALLSPVSEEGRLSFSVPSSRRMSHASSTPDFTADPFDGSVPLSQTPPPSSHRHASAKKASKQSSTDKGSDDKASSHPISSLKSSTPHSSPPPSSAEVEPSYMRNPQWQRLDAAFGDRWSVRKRRCFAASPYKHLPRWDLLSCIFKSGDDCRQEQLAMQLIRVFDHIWKAHQHTTQPHYTHSYTLSGLILRCPSWSAGVLLLCVGGQAASVALSLLSAHHESYLWVD